MGRNNTQFFQVVKEQEYDVASILKDVYEALKEKAHAEGTSIYALVNNWVDAYLQESPEA